MGEALRRHAALVHVTWVQFFSAGGVVAPDAGKAVGPQFHLHRERIRIPLAAPSLRLRYLPIDAEQILHVVPDFMRHHVGLGEVAGGAEAAIEFAEEREGRDTPSDRPGNRTGPSPPRRCRRPTARRLRTGPAPARRNLLPAAWKTRPQLSSVSASTTATNSAAGSPVGAPVGTDCAWPGLASSTTCSSVSGLVPVRHDCDGHLPISYPGALRDPIQIPHQGRR